MGSAANLETGINQKRYGIFSGATLMLAICP